MIFLFFCYRRCFRVLLLFFSFFRIKCIDVVHYNIATSTMYSNGLHGFRFLKICAQQTKEPKIISQGKRELGEAWAVATASPTFPS